MKVVGAAPLVIEWSPTVVAVFDPLTSQTTEYPSLLALHGFAGRHAVVAVSQGSAFIRTLQVPDLSREEIAKIVSIRLGPLLPMTLDDYVSGFRLGPPIPGQGRLAVVGAMRTESLRRIMREAKEAKIAVVSVTPAAFVSWMAAKEQGLSECAVVRATPRNVSVDLLGHGELSYSRFVPVPESSAELDEEVLRTFDIAGVAPSATIYLSTDDLSRLADLNSVARQLFSFELPERREQQQAKATAQAMQRAACALCIALVLAGFAIQRQLSRVNESVRVITQRAAELARARSINEKVSDRSARVADARLLIDRAFHPAQPFSDIMQVLASTASSDAWFTGLTLERGKPVLIRGDALTEGVIPQYVDQLALQPRFRGMKVVFANKASIGKKPVVQFAISGHAIGNLPLDVVNPAKARS